MNALQYDNDVVEFEIEDGILFGKYKVSKIDLMAAKKATFFRKQITQGRKLPSIANISLVKEVPKETREYFSQEAGDDLCALAVIISNPVTRIMGNFFLKFHQPKYPFKLFKDTSSAKKWIIHYRITQSQFNES
ncbi:hypothetical protein [Catalinimonas alkaloidigena]|uniref:DUF7793 family protein n=1 Tax=Catalinimonas alkaloidigena TaxID=1075417 RepID=UPI002406F91C|nr:hypothetical protein [Catalinimonas alkaloidigena]